MHPASRRKKLDDYDHTIETRDLWIPYPFPVSTINYSGADKARILSEIRKLGAKPRRACLVPLESGFRVDLYVSNGINHWLLSVTTPDRQVALEIHGLYVHSLTPAE